MNDIVTKRPPGHGVAFSDGNSGASTAVGGTEVCAVVVTYRFPYRDLAGLLDVLDSAVRKIVLVDNNPQPDEAALERLLADHPSCRIISNHANLGLSKALNQGIRIALEEDFPAVMLFDQDSRPDDTMIPRLIAEWQASAGACPPVAALGPAIVDDRMRTPLPFIRFSGGRVLRHLPDPGHPENIEADMLITSGCLIDCTALRKLGLMDERLFIDNIDLEWGFRARAAGYRLLGVCAAVLRHRLGDRVRRVPGTNRNILVHSPLRQYHIMRNRILLYRRDYVPLAWKVADLPRLLFKLMYFPLLVAPRLENLKMMVKGMRDGLLDR